jgi:acyl-CoA reductase-like NAD-dependent aldehyde dehydrogenase
MTDKSQGMHVPKTYKLYIGGKFPRSESGRTWAVNDAKGNFLANASQASRKDTREAVAAARKAFDGWSKATAYNRGQVLYRVAELLEGRRAQFESELVATGSTEAAARKEVDSAIASWVYYAGWADKYAQVLGAANPVAAPYFNFTLPEAMGVIAIVAPQQAGATFSGLAATLAPVLASGNACVVIPSETNPLSAITLAEVLATSDVPGGVVNVLTGFVEELAPVLASHMDVNAIDLAGVEKGSDLAKDLEAVAAENLKRVIRPRAIDTDGSGDIDQLAQFVELKTVWHPVGV